MELWRRWRDDIRRPEIPTTRDELPFLIAAPLVIVLVAQVTDDGSALEVLMLAPAVLGYVLWGLVPRMPAELFAALVILSVNVAVAQNGDLEGAYFLVVTMVLYVSWHLGSLTRAVAITAAAMVGPWFVSQVMLPNADFGWPAWATACVFTFVLGRALRRQRALIEQLQQAREALAAQAVAEERRRIARELHDLAGHTLAAMLLHVTGARHVLRRDVDEAERALVDAETVGRASLDQIRATVAALRTDERGTDPALAGSADVVALVEEYRRAGLLIDAEIAAPVAQLTGPVGTALHRIAREALANVARHAPGNEVELRLGMVGGDASLVVVDRGRPAVPPDVNGTHFGLVGMTERARAVGGDLEAVPTADGWRVEARLPIAPAASTDEFVPS